MTIELKEIQFGSREYEALVAIRYEVLRKPIGMQLRQKDIENDGKEFHLAAFDGGKAIGCVLLRPIEKDAVQLRQMAIISDYRGKGIGDQLAGFAEETAKKKGYKIIETRARKTAQGFYSKLGYESFPNEFQDEHTLRMRKTLG